MKRKLEVMLAQAIENTLTEDKKTETAAETAETTTTTSTANNAYRFKFAYLNTSCKPAQKPFYRKDDREAPPEAVRSVMCS